MSGLGASYSQHTFTLLVRAGENLCALPAVHVVETMRPLPVEPIAGAAPYVVGLAVIRGTATPVLDLAAALGAKPATGAHVRFVTVRAGERHVALAVDAVLGIREMPGEELGALPPLLAGAAGEAIAAVGARDSRLLLVLEAARLLPPELAR